jgi:bacterioferritin-associated ferredoxin
MYICICNAITDREIRAAVADGATTLSDVSMRLGVGSGCGCCRETAQQLIHESTCNGNCGQCPLRKESSAGETQLRSSPRTTGEDKHAGRQISHHEPQRAVEERTHRH